MSPSHVNTAQSDPGGYGLADRRMKVTSHWRKPKCCKAEQSNASLGKRFCNTFQRKRNKSLRMLILQSVFECTCHLSSGLDFRESRSRLRTLAFGAISLCNFFPWHTLGLLGWAPPGSSGRPWRWIFENPGRPLNLCFWGHFFV